VSGLIYRYKRDLGKPKKDRPEVCEKIQAYSAMNVRFTDVRDQIKEDFPDTNIPESTLKYWYYKDRKESGPKKNGHKNSAIDVTISFEGTTFKVGLTKTQILNIIKQVVGM